ncbi:MAG: prepilin-type N-terminal cleavage/methylation domain-containing protein [Bdellovibrionales bacterium]|nr:prepilin-type N-terminal cleavage/methylation domain-containing protein [Bdellovibrionales bacterium]
MRKESGFTLIELLVVVAIIGILAAIAIPQFAEYRARGFDARAKSDLRNVATAEEAYFVDNEQYLSCDDDECASNLPGIGSLSAGVSLSMTATGTGFQGQSQHENGTSGSIFYWDSAEGGLVDAL